MRQLLLGIEILSGLGVLAVLIEVIIALPAFLTRRYNNSKFLVLYIIPLLVLAYALGQTALEMIGK